MKITTTVVRARRQSMQTTRAISSYSCTYKYWLISTINEINQKTFFCCNTFSFLFCSSISLTVIVWTSSSSCEELLTKRYNYIIADLFFNHQFGSIQFWHSKRHVVSLLLFPCSEFPHLQWMRETSIDITTFTTTST